MKVSTRFAALAVASAALVGGALAAPATADSPQTDTVGTIITHTRGDGTTPPAELGDPEEWGVVEIPFDDAGGISTKKIVKVGGGEWSYGWNVVADGKYCYSNYYHYKVKHGSTAKLGSRTAKDIEEPNHTSNAHLTGAGRHTCQAYWSKY
ncbi:lactococcin 972 family bacteriocin [Actinomycetota bacterium Odt1-20B]